MEVPFVPTTINWTNFASDAQNLMNSKGGLYSNIIVSADLNSGFLIDIPALGFENNSQPIHIAASYYFGIYRTRGVLTSYEFKYGLDTLALYTLIEPVRPWISISPYDYITKQEGYSSFTLGWSTNDLSPGTYIIEGSGIVAGPAPWTSGGSVYYVVPEGFTAGNYTYTITFTDNYGASRTHSVLLIVEASEGPPAIPGYELTILIGSITIVTLSLLISTKRKKNN
jgi:hypothetical protein